MPVNAKASSLAGFLKSQRTMTFEAWTRWESKFEAIEIIRNYPMTRGRSVPRVIASWIDANVDVIECWSLILIRSNAQAERNDAAGHFR
jgi:hypothetical protein